MYNDERRLQRVVVVVSSFAPTLVAKSNCVVHPINRSNNGKLLSPSHLSLQLPSRQFSSMVGKIFMSTTTASTNATASVEKLSSGKISASQPTSSDEGQTKEKDQEENAHKFRQNGPVRRSGSTIGRNFVAPKELESLLDRVDIVSLIESYDLPQFQKTSPDNAKCLCPFHDDRNPSLQINGQRGIYKCFSCGAGGNALKFVREYAELSSVDKRDTDDQKQTPLTFLDAIRVLQECADKSPKIGGVQRRRYQQGSKVSSGINNAKPKKSSSSLIGTTSRERILHANLFAAAYYEESLFGLPSAGLARTHLRSRGILPTTVKAFAIGFAPESYFFGNDRRQQQQQKQSHSWGEGSLVHRLREEGFTPQEILDAGLAVLTRKGKEQQSQSSNKNSDEEQNADEDKGIREREHRDFSTIMDRFRGRLIVPIFDATGSHVLGFGGRVLESSVEASSDFKAAKYLNSPESLVFQKKELLFGQHMVKFATATDTDSSSSKSSTTAASQRRPRSLIIVEGYMDAIALWQAGVKETVASMGTALTKEQLLAAASTARQTGGRVVLCLDNDNAGVAAVTRLCTGSDPILLSVTEQSNIEIFVANLRGGVKDPAEFLEENQEAEDLEEKFRAEVIDGAQEWSKWYMNSLVDAHNSTATDGEDGSFSQIFDKLALFLSNFESVDDRMKKASFIAPKLSDLLDTNDDNDGIDIDRVEASSTTRIQLASNLVEKAAKVAHLKSMDVQRSYQLTVGSRKDSAIPKSLEISQDMALAERGNNGLSKKRNPKTPSQIESSDNSSSGWQRPKPAMERQSTQMNRPNTVRRFQKSMTKHIAGVGGNPFDDEWLGVTKDKYTNERNPLRYELHYASNNNQKYIGPETSVRFNKNNYHGTWTTPDATAAGYVARSNSKNLDFLEKGTSSLVESNEEDRSLSIEDLLFSILVRFDGARKSLYESIRISKASGSGGDILWSAPEKEWLFECLVDEINDIPQGIVGLEDLSELRSYLSTRPDVIPGAFGSTVKQVIEKEDTTDDKTDDTAKSFSGETNSDKTGERTGDHGNAQVHDDIADYTGDMEVPVTESRNVPKINQIPKIPAIGEEWSGVSHNEGYSEDFMSDFGEDMMFMSDVDDAFMDSVGPIDFPDSEFDGEAPAIDISSFENANASSSVEESGLTVEKSAIDGVKNDSPDDSKDSVAKGTEAKSINQNAKTESLVTELVVAKHEQIIVHEGSLDRLFMEGLESYDIFSKFYADEDTMSIGSNEDKANWAVQDLHTMLQFTSVWKRVEAGRKFMEENNDEFLKMRMAENNNLVIGDDSTSSEIGPSAQNTLDEALSEYCFSKGSDGGLRSDLQRIRSLTEKNNQATNRILAMMDTDFTDRSAEVRGYSWLGNVLKFNQMKMVEWNDIIESKESFRPSHEGLEVLEDFVYSDWNELSNPDEMYEFDKNVNLDHRSHFADLVIDRPDSESTEDFTLRVEDEWDVQSWEQDYDEQHGIEGTASDDFDDEKDESPDEFLAQYEDDRGGYDNSFAEDFEVYEE
eukprot:jgi/Psemu1/62880/estExt_Genemark1.C_110130